MDGRVIFVAGRPAIGKSTVANLLAKEHGFTHIEMEGEWQDLNLHKMWDRSRPDFVKELRVRFSRVILNWGFPPACRRLVEELGDAGVTLVWLDAPESESRRWFKERGTGRLEDLERQLGLIREAGLPEIIPRLRVIGVVGADCARRQPKEVARDLIRLL